MGKWALPVTIPVAFVVGVIFAAKLLVPDPLPKGTVIMVESADWKLAGKDEEGPLVCPNGWKRVVPHYNIISDWERQNHMEDDKNNPKAAFVVDFCKKL